MHHYLISGAPSIRKATVLAAVIFGWTFHAHSQSVAAGEAPSDAAHMFRDMDVQERNRIIGATVKLEPIAVFSAWIDAGRIDHDRMKQRGIGFSFSGVLRQAQSNPELYNHLRKFIADRSNSFSERGDLLNILGEAKTKESLDLLIFVATTSQDEGLRQTASIAIRSCCSLWGDGTFHEELSPALERVWRDSNDKLLLSSVAFGIAEIGAPSGVKLLISSSQAYVWPGNFRKRIAKDALREVFNPQTKLMAINGSRS